MVKRKREQEEFPQQLQDGFLCGTVDATTGATVSGAITQTEWRMPVELDLNHPIFIECSKLACTQEPPVTVNVLTAGGVVGCPSQLIVRELKVMKEARGTTTWPLDSDRATLATFRLQSSFVATSVNAQGVTYSDMEKWQYFEDSRTGYGELIAQPRLFVLTRTTVAAAGLANPALVATKNLFLSMHYRMTSRIQGKEYLTELIAKFT